MRTNKILSKIFALVLVGTTLLAGCSSGSTGDDILSDNSVQVSTAETTGTKQTSTFTYAIPMDPGIQSNVVTSGSRYDLTVVNAVYSPLYITNLDESIDYYLATGYEVLDEGKTYRFTLRDDVLWNDGEKFTAEDVAYTMSVLVDPSTGSTVASNLEFDGQPVETVVVDDYTVDFKIPTANPATIDLMSTIFIMPKHIFEGQTNFLNNPLNERPVGTGPYMIDDYKAGEYLTLKANPTYFRGAANIDTVVLRVIENANALKIALQNGEVDAGIVSTDDIESLESIDTLTINPYSEGRVGYLRFNYNMPAMQNEDFRKAIFYALDREAMNNAAYLSTEYYDSAYSFLPPTNKYYDDSVNKYEQDLEKSKEYLEASGLAGTTVKIAYGNTNKDQEMQALLIQDYLSKVGINCEILARDGAAMFTNLQKGDSTEFDMFLGGYIMGNDPGRYASIFVTDGSANYANYSDADVDRLFTEGSAETDPEKRVEIYNEIQNIMEDSASFYPLVDNKKILVTRSDLGGIEEAGLVPVYTFADMSKLKYE